MRVSIFCLLLVLVSCKPDSGQVITIPNDRQFYDIIHRPLDPPVMCGSYQPAQVQKPDELLPEGLNPVEAHDQLCSASGLTVNETMRHVFANFDASKSSVRHYDHVAPLDGITIGMGHWPQNEVSKFFEDMERFPDVKKRFFNRAVEAMQEYGSEIALSECHLQIKKPCVKENIISLLENTVFNEAFMKKHFSKNCRGNNSSGHCTQAKPNMWKQLPWLPKVLKRGFRDKVVTNWQTDFYYRDVIQTGEKLAIKSGIGNDFDSILMLSSLDSSGSSWAKYIGNSMDRGHVEIGGKKYDWNRPEGLVNWSPKELKSWRMLLAFRYYNFKKGERSGGCGRRIRNRQKQFYCMYAKDMWDYHWPDAPTGKSSCRPIKEEITEKTCEQFEPVKPSPCGDIQIQEHD